MTAFSFQSDGLAEGVCDYTHPFITQSQGKIKKAMGIQGLKDWVIE
jgi:hypothetical protein